MPRYDHEYDSRSNKTGSHISDPNFPQPPRSEEAAEHLADSIARGSMHNDKPQQSGHGSAGARGSGSTAGKGRSGSTRK